MGTQKREAWRTTKANLKESVGTRQGSKTLTTRRGTLPGRPTGCMLGTGNGDLHVCTIISINTSVIHTFQSLLIKHKESRSLNRRVTLGYRGLGSTVYYIGTWTFVTIASNPLVLLLNKTPHPPIISNTPHERSDIFGDNTAIITTYCYYDY